MAIPEANVLVKVGTRGHASIEVGGVKMAGVVRVSSEFARDGNANIVIEVAARLVKYEQAPTSVEDATQQIARRLSDIERHQRVAAVGYQHLEEENEALRRQLAERPRVRIPAGSRKSNG